MDLEIFEKMTEEQKIKFLNLFLTDEIVDKFTDILATKIVTKMPEDVLNILTERIIEKIDNKKNPYSRTIFVPNTEKNGFVKDEKYGIYKYSRFNPEYNPENPVMPSEW